MDTLKVLAVICTFSYLFVHSEAQQVPGQFQQAQQGSPTGVQPGAGVPSQTPGQPGAGVPGQTQGQPGASQPGEIPPGSSGQTQPGQQGTNPAGTPIQETPGSPAQAQPGQPGTNPAGDPLAGQTTAPAFAPSLEAITTPPVTPAPQHSQTPPPNAGQMSQSLHQPSNQFPQSSPPFNFQIPLPGSANHQQPQNQQYAQVRFVPLGALLLNQFMNQQQQPQQHPQFG